MYIQDGTITFEAMDMWFVKRFGMESATEMVLDYTSQNDLPFVYDTHQLAHFLHLPRHRLFRWFRDTSSCYLPVELPKKGGGVRHLHVPNATLKNVQRRILHEILLHLPISPYATAYVKGKRLSDNAVPHCGHRYLLKLDITDFFGSIRFDQVYSAAFNTTRYPKLIGVMLTALCCYEDVLPQGAPTSPTLSNVVMRQFDNRIGEWCKKRGITYTRYCDDMTFSADIPLYTVYRKVHSMLGDMGFSLNEKKTRFVTRASRQSVTGLTVNEQVAVSSDYKRDLRQQVHYALKFGFADALTKRSDRAFRNAEHYAHHLIGCVRYVLQIEPHNTWFQTALQDLLQKEIGENVP